MKIDYHLHGEFSADSNIKLIELASKAVRKSYFEIAVTEHFDFIPSEIAEYGIPSYHKYTRAIEQLRQSHPGLNILRGVELGEYHLSHQLADAVFEDDQPDLKIGSIHLLADGTNVSTPMKQQLTDKIIRDYYEENLALVKFGNFDILGHLGVHKRYLLNQPDEAPVKDKVERIFRLIIEKGIALEVNLSGLAKPMRSLIPSPEHLKLYKELGGELITIGSDSHNLEDFDNYYISAIRTLRGLGFSNTVRKSENGWDKVYFSSY